MSGKVHMQKWVHSSVHELTIFNFSFIKEHPIPSFGLRHDCTTALAIEYTYTLHAELQKLD